MKHLLVFNLFLLIGLTSSQYNPLKDPKICGRPTCKGQQKFKYTPGVRYSYEYSTDIKTFSEDSSSNKSVISAKGEVSVIFLTECDGLLELSNFKFNDEKEIIVEEDDVENESEDDPKSELFSETLSKSILRFSFTDGLISEICPDENEENWVLNFKRGILSMINNNMRRFDLDYVGIEDDIHGKCQASYILQKARDSVLVIEKTKDFASCQGRSQLHSSIQSTPYYFKTNQQRTNPLKSSSVCELSVDNRIYSEIICKEVHHFQPFSKKTADATTIVQQKLEYISESQEEISVDDQALITRRLPLLYDQKTISRLSLDSLKAVRDLIRTMCRLGNQDVQTEYADTFSTLIRTSRTLSYSGLYALMRHSNIICPNGKKFLLDALPYLGSDAAIEVIKDLSLGKEIPDTTLRPWITTISFLPHPTATMITALFALMKEKINDSIIVLSITSLVHTYCIQNTNCYSKEPIKDIVQLLESHLVQAINRKHKLGDKISQENEQQIFIMLKGIGNIGIVSEDFQETLDSMVEDPTLEATIRVAVVETYRRLPCENVRPLFERVFKNDEQDSEIRIAAYLQIMKCPDYKTILNIQNILQNEQVNQVGSFVWSHLNNLLKSSIPNRLEIQGLLSDKELKKKFSTDVRKFSRNFEGSVFFDELNFGGNYESNIIFSPSSYIPRSLMLNMTVDIFGQSINFFEIYGRIEGFERYMEGLFGNKGPLSYEKVKDKIPKIRWPRSTEEYNSVTNDINNFGYKLNNNFNNPKISTGFKIFGNDVRYEIFNGEDQIKASLKKFNLLDYLKQILSGKEINLSKSALFMDTSYVVPTGSGFPLSLNILGTASFNLKLFGSLKISNVMKSKEFDLFGSIRPNMAVNIVGTMSVNGVYGISGVKVKTNVYSSSSAEASIKIKDNKFASVKISLPQQTAEIFGAESQLIVVKGDRELNIDGDQNRMVRKTMCSWSAVDKTIGLKLCAHVHFTNDTKKRNDSYLSLAGPAGFRISLHKSDISIKTYSFEYSWKETNERSSVTIIFDTPGSLVRRMISANFTLDPQTFNASLLIQSASGQVYAQGNFKNSKSLKYFQATLDIDDKKHFEATLSLEQQTNTHGYTFLPKLYLEVNSERVAELFGTFKWIRKKGILQCDVDLKFQTKRLTSKLFGYVTHTEASFGTNLKLDYKFAQTREQRVRLEMSLENRSSRIITAIRGNLLFETTTYSQFNFDVELKFQRAAGRMECKIELHTNPPSNGNETDVDFNRLKILALVVQKIRQDGMRFSTVFSVQKQSNDVDLRLDLSYETRGPNMEIFFLVRYAEDKDVIVSLFWSRPRGTFEHIEGRLNVTLPSFTPMILEGKINEKLLLDYDVELSGTWFSGHSFSSVGVYQDKSTSRTSNHRIKFLIKSPSFSDIHADFHVYRDNSLIEIDLQADQNSQDYVVFFKHTTVSNYVTSTQARVKYQSRIYSVTNSVNWKDQKQIVLELHLDTYRDIHFEVWGKNQNNYKSVGMEIKWNANRDPNQKLSFLIDFSNPQIYDYSGKFVLSYPGRSLNGVFHFLLQDGYFSVLGRISWGTNNAIGASLQTIYKNSDKELIAQISSELITPFEDWKKTSFNMGFNHGGNITRLNGSVHWQIKQHVSFDLLCNYLVTDPSAVEFKFVGTLVSTVQDLKSMSAKLDHKHNKTKVDTLVHVMYEPDKLINIKSNWQIVEDINMTNLTGSVSLNTPFHGYKKGILLSKIYITNDRNLRGVADLNLDHKKFTASVKGHLQKFTNSMLMFNITTPNEKYKELQGQLGFSEENRHLVALVQYPSGNLGTEVRLSLTSTSKFDVKFFLATPIDFLLELLLVAKLQSEMLDFRGGWNHMIGGVTGMWHKENITDFHYACKIYVPIQDYEVNGAVAKLILREGLDSEFSLKVAQYQAGLKVVGQPKPKLLKELDIKMEDVYSSQRDSERVSDLENISNDPDFVDERDPISWTGLVEIDTLVYPTIRGTLEIDQLDNSYTVSGTLKLPNGQATFEDVFVFDDILCMNNHLELNTPFESFKMVNSDIDLDIDSGRKYLISFDFTYQNGTELIMTSLLAKYVLEYHEENELTRKINGHIRTPLKNFPVIEVEATLEAEENVFRVNTTATINKSNLSADVSMEFDEGLLELEGEMCVSSTVLSMPPVHFFVKKDFSEVENHLEIMFNTSLNQTHKFVVELFSRYQSLLNFKGNLLLQMPFQSMDKSQIGAQVSVTNRSAEGEFHLELLPINLLANMSLKDSILRSHILANINRDKHSLVLLCTLRKTTSLTKDARGHLMLNGGVYTVFGVVEYSEENIPIKVLIQIEPRDKSSPYLIQYLNNPEHKESILMLKRQNQEIVALQTKITDISRFEKIILMKINTMLEQYKTFEIETRTMFNSVNSSIDIRAKTPFPQIGNPIINVSLTTNSLNYRNLKGNFILKDTKGNLECSWIWLPMKNIRAKLTGNLIRDTKNNNGLVELFYNNEKEGSFLVGGLVNINQVWLTFANVTLNMPEKRKIDFSGYLKLPPPRLDTHCLTGEYYNVPKTGNFEYSGNYKTTFTKKNYGSSGQVSYGDTSRIHGALNVEWGKNRIKNLLDLSLQNKAMNFQYKVNSPYYVNEDTFTTNLTYKGLNNYHNISFHAFSPASRQIAIAYIDYESFRNMNGTMNVTTPFKGFNYTATVFDVKTTSKFSDGHLELLWPKNKVLVDMKTKKQTDFTKQSNNTHGTVVVEIPLNRKHVIKVDYSYKEKPQLSVGTAALVYNNSKIVDGKYKCISESKRGSDKETVNIELENKWLPLGLIFIRGYKNMEELKKMNSKRIEIYHLHNKTKFNITGELVVYKTETGQNISLTAVNLNRTVKLWTNYDIRDQIFKQHSKLELEPTVWIAYDLFIENKTKTEDDESKLIEINLSYPLRNFTSFLEYSLTNSSLTSDTWLKWENSSRHLEASFEWIKDSKNPNHHLFDLEFRHPSFEKNVSFTGEYESVGDKLLEVELKASYSNDPTRDLKVGCLWERNLNSVSSNYSYKVWSNHSDTNLHLNGNGDFFWRPRFYYTSHFATYQRIYIPVQTAETFGKLDWDEKEIELKRQTIREFLHFWGKYRGKFPLYTANMTALHSDDVNSNGTFYLNINEKLFKMEVNLTEDGSQSLQGYGYIPDARSAVFDIWRQYEDISISDVAYYVRLNHSRLIVSSLEWRPELKRDIKGIIKAAALAAYRETIESIDYWRHFIRAEIADTISDISENAQPFVEGFIEDLKELKVVEEDVKKLQLYLNKSYYANEFYIRDLVRVAVYAVDELSIRSQLESLPAFVKELWDIMGESGKKIQKGIQWAIERVKFYYKSAAEFFNGLLQGESGKHLSDALKKLIEKYDNFIKEMHVTFIRYMETLWDKTYTLLVDNWHKTLAAVEPTFIKIVHYLETMVWNASKEFLDFLYLRKNELIESPYFSKFTHFTHDLDKFYRDMTGNETIWKIIEYSKIGWNFLKEKYFELVPFSRELQNVTKEIVDEVNELKKLPSIRVLLTKIDDLSNQIKWFWDYFDVENKIRVFITQLHLKLTDITQTALQAESRYREAKTLFVFEPKDGIMHYEQKLPISWHAFNDMPKFEEIPEYRVFYEVRNYFVVSKTTFWNFYYNFKPYTDPTDWLPPFKSQAILAGKDPFFITFDRVFYNYRSSCSHLLASDFLDRNFSVAISYSNGVNVKDPYEIIFVTNATVLHINIFNKVVRVENKHYSSIIQLPFETDGTILYQELDIITLEKPSHFSLQCNTKFFVCTFQVSGWYFGKTAGLWGTMNYEPSDDLLSPNGEKMKLIDSTEFGNSWSLKPECRSTKELAKISSNDEMKNLCEILYTSKVSPFSACFSRVSIEPFWNMCLKSKTEQDACSVAIAYMNLCAIENTPLRIPENCVKCDLLNGTSVDEGQFINYGESSIPWTVDLVFIIEAKNCNEDLRNKRNIDVLLELIDKELKEKNITNNRFAVVLFGGDGVYDKPRAVVSNGTVFTNFQFVSEHFNTIPTGNGNSDIFGAIAFATKLLFRPGVSKTFIIMPCSDCLDNNMKLDYGILHQVLLESDITLHILMNQDFDLHKSRYGKALFGIDRSLAYTRKDVREFLGDSDLRKQIKLPKATLGFCIPLALESDGSLFSAKKLEGDKKQASKRFATVFAKRITKSCRPAKCQMCECTAANTGVSYMECFPCDYPNPTFEDYGFNEEEVSSFIQPLGEGLYGPGGEKK